MKRANDVSLVAVRERERESYTLETKCVTLFDKLTHTHTISLVNRKNKNYINIPKDSDKNL